MKKTYNAKKIDCQFRLNRNPSLSFCASMVEDVFDLPEDCTELTFELTDRKPRDDEYHVLEWDDGIGDYRFRSVKDDPGWNPILSMEVAFIRRAFPKAEKIYISVYA